MRPEVCYNLRVVDDDFKNLTDFELENRISEAISEQDAAMADYSKNSNNLGNHPQGRMPQTPVQGLGERTRRLEEAEARYGALMAEKARRRTP